MRSIHYSFTKHSHDLCHGGSQEPGNQFLNSHVCARHPSIWALMLLPIDKKLESSSRLKLDTKFKHRYRKGAPKYPAAPSLDPMLSSSLSYNLNPIIYADTNLKVYPYK